MNMTSVVDGKVKRTRREEMIEDIDLKFRWYKHRFFVIIKINALLKVARRLAKDNQKERAKTFIDSATEIIEAYALW